MKIGIPLARLRPDQFAEMAVLADELGYESVWVSEHLVLPAQMTGALRTGEDHPPIPHTAPVFDAFALLASLAARTTRINLGTFVYLLAIRHPFVGARGFATLDVLSQGRAIAGVGAGWLANEWLAAGLDPTTRGRRLDEAIALTRRLWTDDTVAADGEFYRFDPVGFAPKPVQAGGPPILVGGESQAAMRRAILLGDGWIAMDHDLDEARALIRRFRALEAELGHEPGTTPVTLGADARRPDDLAAWEALGVDRIIVAPWQRTGEAPEAIRGLAEAWS
ncbi:MAG: TIGR03619 family F420-dependent LLM class oxidoreductase [Actinobacteria bacterium]|nr:TIGR03619 family F420-dependent LLM class oxidoreductase [Actinomycetota bacterium]